MSSNRFASVPLLVSLICPLAAQGAESPETVDEVLITATRRESRLMETPVSITALSGDSLRGMGADSFSDFANRVPGLTSIDVGPGQKRYALRGLQSAGEPEVALYYDEIPISGLPGASLDTGDSQPDIKLWDVDRIEVIRGPQGTLYGNGSIGGAIRILSRRPALDRLDGAIEATAAATAEGSPSWRVNSMLNVPIIDNRLAVRVTGYYRREGGWLDNPYRPEVSLPQIAGSNLNTERTWGGRASITFQATDAWSITGIAYYQNLETGSSFETYPSYATAADPFVTQAYVRTPWIDESQMFNLISTTHLAWADLTVSGSYQKRIADINLDSTRYLLSMSGCTDVTWNRTCFGPANVPADSSAHQSVEARSGELRLSSPNGAPVEWTVGLFSQSSETSRRGQLALVDAAGNILFDPSTGDAIDRLFARTNFDTFDQYAAFGELTIPLTRNVEATAGARWFHSDRSDQQILVQQFFPGAPVGPQPFQEYAESAWFKKFRLTYHPVTDHLLYVEAAQGFRAGGPNYPGGFALTAPPYRSDSAWSYEGGWKFTALGNRLKVSAALFQIDWKDVQQLLPVQIFSSIINGGDARARGFESEVEASMGNGFSADLGIGYSDAHLVGPQPAVTNAALALRDGDRLGGVPRWTARTAINYARSVSSDLDLQASVNYSYTSRRANIVSSRSPSYFEIAGRGLADAHLTLTRNDGIGIGVHVGNLFNDFVPLSGKIQDGNQIRTVTAARPRTISLVLSARL